MTPTSKEDAVYTAFGANHQPEQFESNRNIGLGAAGICAAIALTIVQTQLKTGDAATSMLYSCIAIPLYMLAAFVNEYFFFLGERSYGFYKYVRIPLRIINTAAGGLLALSFAYAARTISLQSHHAILMSAAGAAFAFWVFHQSLAIWLAKQPAEQR